MPLPETVTGFRARLIDAGVLVDAGAPGLYARSAQFERVTAAVSALVRAELGDPAPTQLSLPWVIAAPLLESTDYLSSFPDLAGAVFGFSGTDADHAQLLALLEREGDWTDALRPTDMALCSAGCHPIYPMYAGRRLARAERIDAVGHCFRNEPSEDPARMRTFRQHEQICIGSPAAALAHRDGWLDRAQQLFDELDLPVAREIANDPFFGRAGRMLASGQRAGELKVEVVADIGGAPRAITSANAHLDHFTTPFDIAMTDGVAHTSCIGFGLERVALALYSRHGLDAAAWPTAVRRTLWP